MEPFCDLKISKCVEYLTCIKRAYLALNVCTMSTTPYHMHRYYHATTGDMVKCSFKFFFSMCSINKRNVKTLP